MVSSWKSSLCIRLSNTKVINQSVYSSLHAILRIWTPPCYPSPAGTQCTLCFLILQSMMQFSCYSELLVTPPTLVDHYICWNHSMFSHELYCLHNVGLISSSSIPVNSATEFILFVFTNLRFLCQLCLSTKFYHHVLALIFSNLQKQFSFIVHVNVAP